MISLNSSNHTEDDSLGSSLALLGDGSGAANGSRSRNGRFREVTKGSRGDLSHDSNKDEGELHLEMWLGRGGCIQRVRVAVMKMIKQVERFEKSSWDV